MTVEQIMQLAVAVADRLLASDWLADALATRLEKR